MTEESGFFRDFKSIWEEFAPSGTKEKQWAEQKPQKEPRWFAYFDDGYDSQWMESYHTKKEAVADIKIHRDSFECLIKGKIVK